MIKEIAFAAYFLLWLAINIWSRIRGSEAIRQWALENGYEVISLSVPWFNNNGPFRWTRTGQPVFRFAIRDRDGVESRGWARWGYGLIGMIRNLLEIEFD